MKFNKEIFETSTILFSISQAINSFNKGKFLYIISRNEINNAEVAKLTSKVRRGIDKIDIEYYNLYEFSKTFNDEFATDDNDKYEIERIALRKLRVSFGDIKEIFLTACPIKTKSARKYKLHGVPTPSIYIKSYLAPNEPYYMDLFDFDSCIPSVKELFEAMVLFFEKFQKCVRLCFLTVQQFNYTKSHPELTNIIYNKDSMKILKLKKNRIIDYTDEQVARIKKRNPFFIIDDICPEMLIFTSKAFHCGAKREFFEFVTIKFWEQKKENNLSDIEILLCKGNIDKLEEIKYVITHFDELLPDDYKYKKLPIDYIANCIMWMGGEIDFKHSHEYFCKLYKEAGGCYDVHGYKHTDDIKNQIKIGKGNYIGQEDFEEELQFILCSKSKETNTNKFCANLAIG